MFTMDPLPPVYFDRSFTQELAAEYRYRELVARLIKGAHENGRHWVTSEILAVAYPSNTAWPEQRDITAFERHVVTEALNAAEKGRWCDDVHSALAEAFSPVWDLYTHGVSPLYFNDKFHHPTTGLAWDGDKCSWYVNCRREDDTQHCACGHQCTDSCRRTTGMVDDSRGHHFHSTDSPTMESCYRCGAMFTLLVNTDGYEYYRGGDGEAITYCSGDTGQLHGEQDCNTCKEHEIADDGSCVHTQHECNCLYEI